MTHLTTLTKLATLAVAVLFGAVVFVSTAALSPSRPTIVPRTPAQASAVELKLNAPERVIAGQGFTVDIAATWSGSPPPSATVTVAVLAALDAAEFQLPVSSGSAKLEVPAELTMHSGLLLVAADLGTLTAQTQISIDPGPVAEPIVALVGPRTIVADGADFSMGVAIPTDQFGNPLPVGTTTTISLQQPGGETTRFDRVVNGGLIAALLPSGTRAGRATVTAQVGAATGPVAALDQVASDPAAIRLAAQDTNRRADGFTLHEIATDQLVDVNGNVIPDGIAAHFVIASASGTSILDATVQRGAARVHFEAPTMPGEIQIVAMVGGQASQPLTMEFASGIGELSATLDEFGTTVAIGPVLTPDGSYVADGTVATIQLADGEPVAKAWLYDGRAELKLGLTTQSEGLVVNVLGKSVDVGQRR